jgi:hypothetical protein
MKSVLFVLGILVVTGGIGTRAEAAEYPWCAHYDMGDEVKNCGFVSFEQCLETVRGIGGFCQQNVYYQPSSGVAVSPRSSRKHRSDKRS